MRWVTPSTIEQVDIEPRRLFRTRRQPGSTFAIVVCVTPLYPLFKRDVGLSRDCIGAETVYDSGILPQEWRSKWNKHVDSKMETALP